MGKTYLLDEYFFQLFHRRWVTYFGTHPGRTKLRGRVIFVGFGRFAHASTPSCGNVTLGSLTKRLVVVVPLLYGDTQVGNVLRFASSIFSFTTNFSYRVHYYLKVYLFFGLVRTGRGVHALTLYQVGSLFHLTLYFFRFVYFGLDSFVLFKLHTTTRFVNVARHLFNLFLFFFGLGPNFFRLLRRTFGQLVFATSGFLNLFCGTFVRSRIL